MGFFFEGWAQSTSERLKYIATLTSGVVLNQEVYGSVLPYGAVDVIFSFPQHGSDGRALVHEGNNVLTINYAGDFSNGVKIGNYLWIANDGTLCNVGISTTTPKAKLSVNGNILANEIKIKTNIEVPDYVFLIQDIKFLN